MDTFAWMWWSKAPVMYNPVHEWVVKSLSCFDFRYLHAMESATPSILGRMDSPSWWPWKAGWGMAWSWCWTSSRMNICLYGERPVSWRRRDLSQNRSFWLKYKSLLTFACKHGLFSFHQTSGAGVRVCAFGHKFRFIYFLNFAQNSLLFLSWTYWFCWLPEEGLRSLFFSNSEKNRYVVSVISHHQVYNGGNLLFSLSTGPVRSPGSFLPLCLWPRLLWSIPSSSEVAGCRQAFHCLILITTLGRCYLIS